MTGSPGSRQISRYSRHLGWLYQVAPEHSGRGATRPMRSKDYSNFLPAEFNWHEHVVMLLHTAAEIEHSLMVEYLFAAYTLGGPQVPPALKLRVRRWQEVILGIAKEEMGHLLTVQNVLTLLRAPLNLRRQEYSWSSDVYPFPFTLERLEPDTLATFVCAESPPNWTRSPAPLVKRVARAEALKTVNRVGVLYHQLTHLLSRPHLLPN